MSKYQLTLSPDYVQDWTHVEAIRELFQNALDNETKYPENKMFFSYNDGVLQIGNKTSILTTDTLLLGSSSKRDDDETIGQHGEGYKVAFSVLLREGKSVTVYNYGAREIWTTRLVKSRKYNGAIITEVDIQKKAIFQKVPSHNLIIEVQGISEKEYGDIVESNLHLQNKYNKYETSNEMGSILLDEKYKGKVFVNGLYITTNSNIKYGYDIIPKYINLDRDRKLIDTFNLTWITSKMWRYVEQEDLVSKLLLDEVIDVKYIKSNAGYSWDNSEEITDKKISNSLKDSFIDKYGENSIPVASNNDLQRISKNNVAAKPVLVSESVVEYLENEIELPEILTLSLKNRLQNWFEEVYNKLSDKEILDFELILEDLD